MKGPAVLPPFTRAGQWSGFWTAPRHQRGSPGRDRLSPRDKDQLLSPEWKAGGTTQHRYRKQWEAFLSGPGGYFCRLLSGAQRR